MKGEGLGVDEADRDLSRGHGVDVVHREGGGLVHEAIDRELVGVPVALGHGTCECGAQPSDGRGAGEAAVDEAHRGCAHSAAGVA